MTTTPDFDLLAVTYLDNQNVGPRLREIFRTVATIRTNNPDPGQRRARKADLAAVCSAADRLSKALNRIDINSQADAMVAGLAKMEAARGAEGQSGATLEPTRLDQLQSLSTLKALLHTAELGFGALADGQEIANKGGRPQRHDALLLGLEALDGLWRRHRTDAPTLSENERGFCALAIDVFGKRGVGFEDGTVRNAVVDFLQQEKAKE